MTLPVVVTNPITLDVGQPYNHDYRQSDSHASTRPDNESNQTLTITRVDSSSAQAERLRSALATLSTRPASDFTGPTDSFTFLATDNGTTGGLPRRLRRPGQSSSTFRISTIHSCHPDSVSTNEDTPLTIQASTLFEQRYIGETNQRFRSLELQRQARREVRSVRSGNLDRLHPPKRISNGTDTFTYTIETMGRKPSPQTAIAR